MLASTNVEAQTHAASALLHLSSIATAQQLIVEHGGIALLVGLLAGERLAAANYAAGALWQVASTVSNKSAVVKAGGIPKLVALLQLVVVVLRPRHAVRVVDRREEVVVAPGRRHREARALSHLRGGLPAARRGG